jgi:lipoate-protein ligase A
MKILYSQSNNPFYNIATEELLLKNYTDDFIFLYTNSPSLIIGKHQNAMGEINENFVRKQKIPVVRRLSGGGAVYHDEGNLNFCFIQNGEQGKLVDFARYTKPIVDYLETLGTRVQRNERNNLLIEGRKISGNAEHLFKNRVLHHGTLLFNSDLEKLDDAIKVDLKSIQDKSVKSVRSEVVNIAEFVSSEITYDDFSSGLYFAMKNEFKAENFELTKQDELIIQKLIQEKYTAWNWNFAYSPLYRKKYQINGERKLGEVEVEVKKGEILSIEFAGDLFAGLNLPALSLIGEKHDLDFFKGKLIPFLVKNLVEIKKPD